MVGEALRQGRGQCVSMLVDSLSLLPGLVQAIRENLPGCVVEFATKPLSQTVLTTLPEQIRPQARAFQHLFICEGDFARAFQDASAHNNVEMDATYVSENLVGFPFHIYLVVQKG